MLRSHESEPSESGSASADATPTSRNRKTPVDREDMTLLARDPSCSENSSRAGKCTLVVVVSVLCVASAAAIVWFGRGFLPVPIGAQWRIMPATSTADDQQQLERREEALRQKWMEALQREREARRRWEKRKQHQVEEKRQFDAEREQLAQQEKEKEDEEEKQKEEEKHKLEEEKARLEEQKKKLEEEQQKKLEEEQKKKLEEEQKRQSSEEESQRECKEGEVACPDGCHTADLGEQCYREVQWGMAKGIHAHPEWYPGLDFSSSFKDFQAALNESGHGNCSLPCKWQNSEALRELATCLCIFDVDRTLTAKQGAAKECPGAVEVQGVRDAAYGGGILLLSELATHLNNTFCHACYRGIVTAGDATGHMSVERARVLEMLGGISATLSNTWSHSDDVVSSLVVGALDGHKQESVREIVHWFREQRAIRIEDSRVHFFDDRDSNIQPFAGTGFNARQVACTSPGAKLDSSIGYCGGDPKEVVEDKGVHACPGTKPRMLGEV